MILYNSHDLEDGLKSNLFKIQDIENIPVLKEIISKHKKDKKIFSRFSYKTNNKRDNK